MEKGDLFFDGFEATPTEEWLSVIEKEIGGVPFGGTSETPGASAKEIGGENPLESLQWEIEPGITLGPFYRRQDLSLTYRPGRARDTDWLIADRIDLQNLDAEPDFHESVELIQITGYSGESISDILRRAAASEVLVFLNGGSDLLNLAEKQIASFPGPVSLLLNPFNDGLQESERSDFFDRAHHALCRGVETGSP